MIKQFLIALLPAIAIDFALVIAYFKLTKQKINISKKLLFFIIIGGVISNCLFYVGNPILNNLYTITFLYIIIRLINNEQKSIYYSLIIWLYGMLSDLIIMLIISITNLTYILSTIDIMYIKVLSTIVMIIILLSICSIPFIKKFTTKIINKIEKLNFSLILDLVIVGLLIYLSILCAKDINDSYNITLYISFALILLIVVLLALDKYYNIKRLKEINEILLKNNDFFIKLDNDYRILKHNLTNQLLGIKSFSDGKVKNMIDDLIIKYNSKTFSSKDISKIPRGLNGIIYGKFYTFGNKKIQLIIHNNIKSDIIYNVKPKKFNDLCETLGVLIDNALEAASKSDEKIILINFDETNMEYSIDINNSYKELLDIDSIGTKDYSTKQRKSGIGIFSILNKKGIILKNSINNSIYKTKIVIKKSR